MFGELGTDCGHTFSQIDSWQSHCMSELRGWGLTYIGGESIHHQDIVDDLHDIIGCLGDPGVIVTINLATGTTKLDCNTIADCSFASVISSAQLLEDEAPIVRRVSDLLRWVGDGGPTVAIAGGCYWKVGVFLIVNGCKSRMVAELELMIIDELLHLLLGSDDGLRIIP
jgi:hypothetical protein